MTDVLMEKVVERMRSRGFDDAEARVTDTRRDELQAEFNQASMLRTTQNRALALSGIIDGRRATVSLNKCDDEDIDAAVEDLWISAAAARSDDGNAIAEAQAPQSFERGAGEGDREQMYDRLDEFLVHCRERHPSIMLGVAGVTHVRAAQHFVNSNGVSFKSRRGIYEAQAMFTARDGEDVSSFAYSGASLAALARPLAEVASFERLMSETAQHVRTGKVPGKFTGDLIITPDCLRSFLGFLIGNIGGAPMISGTSVYHGKLGEQVASPLLTLRAEPVSAPGGYFITGDGYPAADIDVVRDGQLRSYLLDLYASRKTGLARAQCDGGCFHVAPGETALDDMIGEVKQGVLLSRFSGGQPSAKGDFSGVAKSSFYIEKGEVKGPVSETMVSGNMAEILMNIVAISRETVDFGSGVYPWVRVSGVVVS